MNRRNSRNKVPAENSTYTVALPALPIVKLQIAIFKWLTVVDILFFHYIELYNSCQGGQMSDQEIPNILSFFLINLPSGTKKTPQFFLGDSLTNTRGIQNTIVIQLVKFTESLTNQERFRDQLQIKVVPLVYKQ
jgi:hypothetical protein